MLKIDLHSHSNFSFDARFSPEEMCLSAIEKGMSVLALTEHYDVMPAYEDIYYSERKDKRHAEMMRLKEKYGNQLILLNAIELGQPHTNMQACSRLIHKYNFDFVLASVHNLADGRDIYEIDYVTPEQCHEIMNHYLDEVIKMASLCDYDSIGHIDFPIRKIEKAYNGDVSKYDLRPFEAKIRKILEIIIQRSKALEVNTRGLIVWHKEICPSDWVLEMYKSMGGKYITIGSDSHWPDRLALGNEEAMAKLKRCGFDYVTYYKDRKPVLMEI